MCDVMLTCKDELHSGQSDLAILGQVALHGWHICTHERSGHRIVLYVCYQTSNTLCTLAHTYIHTHKLHHGACVTTHMHTFTITMYPMVCVT